MKMAISLAVLALGLAACASPTSLRQGKPELDQVVDKASERLAGCISDRFEEANVSFAGVRFSTRPTSNGYSITGDQSGLAIMGGTDTIILVDITKLEASKSRVQFFTHILAGSDRWTSRIRSCL